MYDSIMTCNDVMLNLKYGSWDLKGSKLTFPKIACYRGNELKLNDNHGNLMSKFVAIVEPADGLAPCGTWSPIGVVVAKFEARTIKSMVTFWVLFAGSRGTDTHLVVSVTAAEVYLQMFSHLITRYTEICFITWRRLSAVSGDLTPGAFSETAVTATF